MSPCRPVIVLGLRLAVRAALLAAAAAIAQPIVRSPQAQADEQMRITHLEKPGYPARAMAEGLGPGEVHLLIEVDEFGQLNDLLVVAHTHQVFADALERAVRTWRFEPARKGGQAVPTVMRIEFTFNVGTEGMVFVDRKGPANMSRAAQFAGSNFVFRPCDANELDAPVKPLARVAPAYPKELKSGGVGGRVFVEFYVDGEGRTRFPRVAESVHPLLAACAVAAVDEWRFEPPQRRSQPALVHITQVFDFVADKR